LNGREEGGSLRFVFSQFNIQNPTFKIARMAFPKRLKALSARKAVGLMDG